MREQKNKSSIQCHKNKRALYRVAENLFKSSPWRNLTKVKSVAYTLSTPYSVSPHTNASLLHCIKSQSLCTGLTKMVPDVFPHVIYVRVISLRVRCGPFSCLLSHPEPVPSWGLYHRSLPTTASIFLYLKPGYFFPLPSLEAMSPAESMHLPQPQLLLDTCPPSFRLQAGGPGSWALVALSPSVVPPS